jgi:hypothetical protein
MATNDEKEMYLLLVGWKIDRIMVELNYYYPPWSKGILYRNIDYAFKAEKDHNGIVEK